MITWDHTLADNIGCLHGMINEIITWDVNIRWYQGVITSCDNMSKYYRMIKWVLIDEVIFGTKTWLAELSPVIISCYHHLMLSSHVIILYYHPMLSCNGILCYHPMFLSYYHHVLSSYVIPHVIIPCYYSILSSMLSPHSIIICYHLILSAHVIISRRNLLLSFRW
jgi:hypothetical protein